MEQMERKNVQLELQIASFHLWNSVVSKGDTTILPALLYGAQVPLTMLYITSTLQNKLRMFMCYFTVKMISS